MAPAAGSPPAGGGSRQNWRSSGSSVQASAEILSSLGGGERDRVQGANRSKHGQARASVSRSRSGAGLRPNEGLAAGRVAPRQLGEVRPRDVEVVEVTVIEPLQLVERAVVADPLPRPEHELAEEALLRVVLVRAERRDQGEGEVQHGKVLAIGEGDEVPPLAMVAAGASVRPR